MPQPVRPNIQSVDNAAAVSATAALAVALEGASSPLQQQLMELLVRKLAKEAAIEEAQKEAALRARKDNTAAQVEKMKQDEWRQNSCTHHFPSNVGIGTAIVMQRTSTDPNKIAAVCQLCYRIFTDRREIAPNLQPPPERVGGVVQGEFAA